MTKEEARTRLLQALLCEDYLWHCVEEGTIPVPRFHEDDVVTISKQEDYYTVQKKFLNIATHDQVNYFFYWLFEVVDTGGKQRMLVSEEIMQ